MAPLLMTMHVQVDGQPATEQTIMVDLASIESATIQGHANGPLGSQADMHLTVTFDPAVMAVPGETPDAIADAIRTEPSLGPLLDRVVRRVASAIDPTDTDEGLEHCQGLLVTEINAAIGRAHHQANHP
jgi:hypothetical protein